CASTCCRSGAKMSLSAFSWLSMIRSASGAPLTSASARATVSVAAHAAARKTDVGNRMVFTPRSRSISSLNVLQPMRHQVNSFCTHRGMQSVRIGMVTALLSGDSAAPVGSETPMYLPTQFTEARVPVLHEAIRQARLGTLVTLGEAGLEASHVPMLIDPAPPPYAPLSGHVSRGNPQWRRPPAGVQALAMFLGPNAYISPAWYATKRQTGKVVPTWNYVAIHAYGEVRFFDDAERLLRIVTRLTETHEAGRPEPWAGGDAPPEVIRDRLNGIVRF